MLIMRIIEIALLIGGISAVFSAKVPAFLASNGKYKVEGLAARWIGVLLILPLPIAFLGSAILPLLFGRDGAEHAVMLEPITVLGVAILSVVLVRVMGKKTEPVETPTQTSSLQLKTDIEKGKKLNWLFELRRILGFWGALGILCICPAGVFVLFYNYDAPSTDRLGIFDYVSIYSVISFPIISIVSSIGIWFLKDKYEKLAYYISLLPLVPLILIFALFTWSYVSSRILTIQERGFPTHVAKCALPVLAGGDGLDTTGCGVLKVGVFATGTLSVFEAHNWQFSSQNGNQITIAVEESVTCPQISILDSSGSVIEGFEDRRPPPGFSCSNIEIPSTSFFHFDPPTNDTYTLRLIVRNAGTYWLKIEEDKK